MSISKVLINWYNQNKRDLPWRETNNPYIIWVSEIILQQTRVNQGISYFYRFIEQYPDIKSLASDPIDNILRLWQGLGYYSRARNMYQTANTIVNEYNGLFPKEYSEIIKLKGIGEYTAAAIASFCFNEPVAVIDGNVHRFISRFYGINEPIASTKGKFIFKKLANEIIDNLNPGIHNQAIMEFGALICTPKNPQCSNCPLNEECYAFINNQVSELPIKKKKNKISKRYFNYLHITYNDKTFIEKRVDNDIWNSLYQLPLIETNVKSTLKELEDQPLWFNLFEKTNIKIIHVSELIKHQLSHQQLHTRFYRIEIDNPNNYIQSNYISVNHSDIHQYGIPKLIDNYFANSLY